MAREAAQSFQLWEACAAAETFAQHPPVPLPAQQELIAQTVPVLDAIGAVQSLLDMDVSLLADYAPLAYTLKARMRGIGNDFAEACLRELEAAEQRHLMHPLRSDDPVCDWPNEYVFMEVAALAHPRWRQGRFIDPGVLEMRQQRFREVCTLCFVESYGLPDGNAQVPAEFQQSSPTDKPASGQVPGMGDIFAVLQDVCGQQGQRARHQPPVAHPGGVVSKVKHLIVHMAQSHFTAQPVNTDPFTYWRNTELRALLPGVYFLLSHSAGNGVGERFFSASEHALSNKRSTHMELSRKLMLRHNAP
eukprot:11850084-Karenia_brevis.AAC.2